MDAGQIGILALVIIVPAALLWGVFLARSGRTKKPRIMLGIPHALRPAQPDEKLEGPRLERIMVWGLLATLATALFIPAYWLPETQRQASFTERFAKESIERGHLIFQVPPELPEESDAQAFKEVEREIALGQGCAQCHGGDANGTAAAGGAAPFTDPQSGQKVSYTAPPLNTVFSRWDEEVVAFTIERGRPGTDMPAWGVEYGGPMTEQMVADVIAYLRSIQVDPEPISKDCTKPEGGNVRSCGRQIFEARCAVCHGPEGQGKEQAKVWYQGAALWKGDVGHLSKAQHITTVKNGRRYAFMPAFAEAPTQGIPVPPMPLTDEQIEAVVAYERTL